MHRTTTLNPKLDNDSADIPAIYKIRQRSYQYAYDLPSTERSRRYVCDLRTRQRLCRCAYSRPNDRTDTPAIYERDNDRANMPTILITVAPICLRPIDRPIDKLYVRPSIKTLPLVPYYYPTRQRLCYTYSLTD